MITKLYKKLILICIFFSFSFLLEAQGLYVGTNYHPHDDKNLEKIKKDIFAKFRDMKAKVGHTIPSKWLTLRYYHS